MYIFRVTLIDLIYFIDIVIDLQVQMCVFAVCVCLGVVIVVVVPPMRQRNV